MEAPGHIVRAALDYSITHVRMFVFNILNIYGVFSSL